LPQLGTRTPVLHHDGRDLAAALQTIREIGDSEALDEAINDAFPCAVLNINIQSDGRFFIEFNWYKWELQSYTESLFQAHYVGKWFPATFG